MSHLANLKRTGLAVLCSLLLPAMVLCQAPQVDSLENLLQTSIADTTRMNILMELYEHYVDRDLEKSLSIVEELLERGLASGHQRYVCKGYTYLGTVQRMQNVALDSVLSHYDKALSCCETTGDLECKGKVLNSIGGAYHRSGLHLEAMTHYQQALEIAEQVPDTLAMIACLGNMSSILKRRLDFDKALQYSARALAYARAVDHTSYIGMLTNNLASIYFNQSQLDTALTLYEEALAIKREQGTGVSMAVTLANIGGIHVVEERYEIAQRYLDEAYTISADQNYVYGLVLSLRYMTNSARKQGQFKETIELARRGLEYFGHKEQHQYTRDFHETLSLAFEQLNEPDSALAHLRISRSINDSLFHAEKEQQIQQLEISYQVKQKEVENQLLKTEQSFIEQKLRSRTYIGIGLLIALFFAAAWVLALFRINREKKRMNRLLETEVADRTKELRETNEQLQQANYELKSFNHIASHDLKEPIRNVGNYVGLIHRRLPEDIKTEVQDYFDIIHQSTSQLYTLIEDIASYTHLSKDDASLTTDVDLDAVVTGVESGLLAFITDQNGKVEYEGLPTIRTSSSLIFIALKNLIENGMKFNESEVPTVRIEYQSTPTHHQIIVSDNGIGIDPTFHEHIFTMFKRLHSMGRYPGSGIGLAMVKLAVEKLGGTVDIESKEGEGSTFILDLPKEGVKPAEEKTVAVALDR